MIDPLGLAETTRDAVLEGILYFALGFLSAAMIALMISPVLWSRAVALTKQRIENSVPLTLNEIQADKDQLRAEFAMSTRRLEMSVEELRDKAARQVIEIARKRDELARIDDDSRERIKTIEELEVHASELRAMLKDREDKLVEANSRLDGVTAKLADKSEKLDQLQSELSSIRDEADSSRIELVAKQTFMENLTDQVTDVETREETMKFEIDSLRAEARKTADKLKEETKRGGDLEKRLSSLQKQLSGNERNLTNRERDVARLRRSGQADGQSNSDLATRLVETQSRNVELEARLAQTVLQMEAMLNDASNVNVAKAMETLSKDKQQLEGRLAEIKRERDGLREDLTTHSRQNSNDWEEERHDNAILRERINDLAAQVTAMTSALEGDNSTISKILKSDPPLPKGDAADPAKSRATKGVGKQTLADRIRALQETARATRHQ
jgi:chromosome segregation ATPase